MDIYIMAADGLFSVFTNIMWSYSAIKILYDSLRKLRKWSMVQTKLIRRLLLYGYTFQHGTHLRMTMSLRSVDPFVSVIYVNIALLARE